MTEPEMDEIDRVMHKLDPNWLVLPVSTSAAIAKSAGEAPRMVENQRRKLVAIFRRSPVWETLPPLIQRT